MMNKFVLPLMLSCFLVGCQNNTSENGSPENNISQEEKEAEKKDSRSIEKSGDSEAVPTAEPLDDSYKAVEDQKDPIEDSLMKQGAKIALHIQQELSATLLQSFRDKGLKGTIKVCSEKAIPLTTSLNEKIGVKVQRVSHKSRNKDNQADEEELKVIHNFIQQLNAEEPVDPLIRSNDDGSHTFFAPIVIRQPLCLQCHGKVGWDIKTKDYEIIKEIYPADSAVGFKMNELRGMWRIDFPQNKKSS